MIPTLQMCSNKECPIAPYQYAIKIKNDLILDIRKCIKRYYENWLVCDNPSCKSNSRNFSHVSVYIIVIFGTYFLYTI